MTTTILGVFDDALVARQAMDTLRDSVLPFEDISIITRQTESGGVVSDDDDVSAGEGAAVGAVWGGLVGLGALLIPGIGPFIAGGALFAALTGAVAGAVVGGITAALVDFGGITHEEAGQYEDMVKAGKTLVAVKARDEDAQEARRMLVAAGAAEMRGDVTDTTTTTTTTTTTGVTPPRVAMYSSTGGRIEPDIASPTMPVGPLTPAGSVPIIEPTPGGASPVVRDAPVNQAGATWTSGEVVGEGQGVGPRADTGRYDADQWAGETQRPGQTPGDTWTSGEVVGEGQGVGPRTDTGTHDSRQWVGEGQGAGPVGSGVDSVLPPTVVDTNLPELEEPRSRPI